MKKLVLTALLTLSPGFLSATELVLDSVMATQGGREVALRVGGRATFELDPALGVLRSEGTWTATFQPPHQHARFTHQVEDMRASADGELSMRSYECVEGVFGAELLAQSVCGRYSFGPNMLDDGGAVDDESRGEPISLAGWSVEAFDWDGRSLILVLVPSPQSTERLELRFATKPPR